jgi:FkbM family methyltransferase
MMLRTGWVRLVARANRAVLRHWPRRYGRELAFRVLNRASARHGVLVDARTAWGGRFRCDLRDLVQSRVYYFGVWEPSLTALVEQRLQPGDVFVDVGANVGYFSLLAAQRVGPAGSVVSVEASPRVAELLRGNVALTGADNVRVLNVAAADRHGTVAVYAGPPGNVGTTSLLSDHGGRYETHVPAAPLTTLLEPAELERVRLLKIDVEGAELPILLDILANIHAFSPSMEIVAEISPDALRDAGTSFQAVAGRFAEHGFAWYVLQNDYGLGAYLDAAPRPPVRGTAPPTGQVDVLFSRAHDGDAHAGTTAR